ncbi:uncharacterized protein BT62DRAFT_923470 [Guyanagaster necrorhizus]|uniref:Uncharacterized protein n=1 Tax=Guyanagaster necrorhizus TaxID=856835 RepID=A0A9P7VIN8_9AGAR|nr:uncharacterized protein BT62DRAFT_923470 [Guyanagaster necrorhizus MCA 3950]KAG7441250.1 hypothetical protein BT62DRAFT_923470 [Guyanagaster necrorhizus MCA 3950]
MSNAEIAEYTLLKICTRSAFSYYSFNANDILNIILVPTFSQTPTIRNALISLFATSVAAEFILSVAMIYTLNKGRTASVFPKVSYKYAGQYLSNLTARSH